MSDKAEVVWVGHRGYPELYPENSLLGIEKALQLGARAIEIDPRYADVTVRRWQKMTGGQAVLEASNVRFNELEEHRD